LTLPSPFEREVSASEPRSPHAYQNRRVLVAGTGVAGAACADVLLGLGAEVTVLDRAGNATIERLRGAGARWCWATSRRPTPGASTT
jgi:cation diffusion facilitator CzcD-associated flavoprotein CzcO